MGLKCRYLLLGYSSASALKHLLNAMGTFRICLTKEEICYFYVEGISLTL